VAAVKLIGPDFHLPVFAANFQGLRRREQQQQHRRSVRAFITAGVFTELLRQKGIILEESYDPVSTEAVASTISCTLAM
jgi:hypothetical protein